MKVNNEILNKYLDGELSTEEVKELEKSLDGNPSIIENLKALKLVDNILNTLEHDPAPSGITEKIMSKIESLHSVRNQKNYFFYVIISIFTLTIITLFGFFFANASFDSGNLAEVKPITEKVNLFFSESADSVIPMFQNTNTLLIGASLTLILFISAYFLYDSHKTFRRKIDGYVH